MASRLWTSQWGEGGSGLRRATKSSSSRSRWSGMRRSSHCVICWVMIREAIVEMRGTLMEVWEAMIVEEWAVAYAEWSPL
jgi:hypothetical protein